MLSQLSEYASSKDVDFIILISDLDAFYTANGYLRLSSLSSWLRIHEHKNFFFTALQLIKSMICMLNRLAVKLGQLVI